MTSGPTHLVRDLLNISDVCRSTKAFSDVYRSTKAFAFDETHLLVSQPAPLRVVD